MVYAGLAYALHYLPFFFMNRTLFLHHYLPAMAFAYVISGITAEYLYWLFYAKLKPSLARGFVALSLFSALVIFAMFAPMTYGLESPRWERYLVWRRGWNFLVYQK
jgi:dolichyl-phosphate-mannose-protein mannosyltransferase